MQVFISFSSADSKIAEKIHDRLNKKGIECWICTRNIPPGADYQACIVEAINASEVVVLVFSSKANLSPEIAKELSLASKKILIPARIEDVVPQGSFQYQLSNRQFVDLFDDFDNKLDELAERIKSVLAATSGKPAPAPATRRPPKKARSLQIAGAAALVLALAAGGWMVKGKLAGPAADAVAATPRGEPAPAVPVPAATPVRDAAVLPAAPAASPAPVVTSAAASVTPAAATPAVASQVGVLLPLLGTAQTYDRINLMRTLLDRVPMGLSVSDANAMLQGSGGQRAAGIALIAANLAEQLDGNDVARLLDPMTTYDRVNTLRLLAERGKVKQGLSAAEARLILEGSQGQRAAGIAVLAPRLAPQLSGKDTVVVLGDMETYDRVNSLRLLVNAGKVATGLQPEDARILLQGSGGQRAAGISAIANNLAAELDGKGLAVILGETATYDRVNSLRTLSSAHRIGKVQSADMDLVLQNLESQRTPALQLLAQYMPR